MNVIKKYHKNIVASYTWNKYAELPGKLITIDKIH